MDSRGNPLNLDVGRLQKLSFKTAKFLEKGRFQSYITCGEVVEWSMRQSLKEYIPAVVRSWWAIIGLLVEALGIGSGVSGNTILLPYWAWLIIGIIGLIVAQVLAYHKLRKQRDEGRNKVASAISELESEIVSLGGQYINIARLFWYLGEHFLRGIPSDSIFSTMRPIFEKANADELNKAERSLMFKLRSLQLIRDEQRQHKTTRYIVTISTDLGASVINELAKKWRVNTWSPWAEEKVSPWEGYHT